jgi:hypothetical protein
MNIDKQIEISKDIEDNILELAAKVDGYISPNLNVLIKESTNKVALKDMDGVGGY